MSAERLQPEDAPSPALAHLVSEVRASGVEIDWSKVEARLFDQHGNVRDHGSSRAPARSSRIALVATVFAAAAAFAVALSSPSRTVTREREVGAQASVVRAPVLDGKRSLQVGEVVVASASGLHLRSAGRIELHLAPGTHARLLDDGERIHFALESGAITAEVVPVAGGEPFAIDVGGKRVAVHGTRLTVALRSEDGSVEVAVAEGSAVVGLPVGLGRTEGPVVPGGAVGRFTTTTSNIVHDPVSAARRVNEGVSLQATTPATATTVSMQGTPNVPSDTSSDPKLPTPSTIAPKPATTHVASGNTPAVPASPDPVPPIVEPVAPPPPPAPGLTAAEYGPGIGKVQGALKACWTNTKATFSFDSNMTVTIEPNGTVSSAAFDPPLDSGPRDCLAGSLKAIKFPASPGGKTVVNQAVKITGQK